MNVKKKKVSIVLGVTGSIAAYKAAELVRLMIGRGWDVSVVMTEAATRFVAPLTFRTLSKNPVCVGMFDDSADWKPEHIALSERGDLLVIAPCTANVIGKLACGIADDLLSCVAMAAACPVVIAPAMNERMLQHPATQSNLRTLAGRGVAVLDVGEGDLACGCKGSGRMMEPAAILTHIEKLLGPG
jgi:phosphopantothenoylcysteine decarboxylase/phosphopantothenate--cysteine ligase